MEGPGLDSYKERGGEHVHMRIFSDLVKVTVESSNPHCLHMISYLVNYYMTYTVMHYMYTWTYHTFQHVIS